jgi:adenylate kinase family enzyme
MGKTATPGARRIVLLGCAGTGKTALAERISQRAGLPTICMDEMRRSLGSRPDWSVFRSRLIDAHAGDAWISDGNFAQISFDIRLPRAELIVWLERPSVLCAWWACKRVFRRDDAHRLRDLPKVLKFILNFDRVNRPIIEAERLTHGPGLPIIYGDTLHCTSALLESLSRDESHLN